MANNLEVALRDHAQTNGGVTLMKSVLEFLVLITPQDLTTIVYLARLYMTYNMDTSRLDKLIMNRVCIGNNLTDNINLCRVAIPVSRASSKSFEYATGLRGSY